MSEFNSCGPDTVLGNCVGPDMVFDMQCEDVHVEVKQEPISDSEEYGATQFSSSIGTSQHIEDNCSKDAYEKTIKQERSSPEVTKFCTVPQDMKEAASSEKFRETTTEITLESALNFQETSGCSFRLGGKMFVKRKPTLSRNYFKKHSSSDDLSSNDSSQEMLCILPMSFDSMQNSSNQKKIPYILPMPQSTLPDNEKVLFDRQNIENACQFMRSSGCTYQKAAKIFGIPGTVLKNKFKEMMEREINTDQGTKGRQITVVMPESLSVKQSSNNKSVVKKKPSTVSTKSEDNKNAAGELNLDDKIIPVKPLAKTMAVQETVISPSSKAQENFLQPVIVVQQPQSSVISSTAPVVMLKPPDPIDNTTRTYKQYTDTDLKQAISWVMDNKCPITRAARIFGIPLSTLQAKLKMEREAELAQKQKEAYKQTKDIIIVQPCQEKKIFQYLALMHAFGYHLSKRDIIHFAQTLENSDDSGKKFLQCSSTCKIWYQDFVKRNPDVNYYTSYKKFTSENVKHYFHILRTILNKHDLMNSPELIYKIDDIGIGIENLPRARPAHLIIYKDSPVALDWKTSSPLFTLIGCGNALGTALPPFFVLNGANFTDEFVEKGPPGTNGMNFNPTSSKSTLRKYIEDHFLRYVQMGDSKKGVLLLYNGNSSLLSVDDIEWARQNKIYLYVLPPHCYNKDKPLDPLEPFDVGLFSHFHFFSNEESRSFTGGYVSKTISIQDVSYIAGKAYYRCLSWDYLSESFKKCGVHPFNPQIYIDALNTNMRIDLQNLMNSLSACGNPTKEVCPTNVNKADISKKRPRNSAEEETLSTDEWKMLEKDNKHQRLDPEGPNFEPHISVMSPECASKIYESFESVDESSENTATTESETDLHSNREETASSMLTNLLILTKDQKQPFMVHPNLIEQSNYAVKL